MATTQLWCCRCHGCNIGAATTSIARCSAPAAVPHMRCPAEWILKELLVHPQILHLIQNATSISHNSLQGTSMSRTLLWSHCTDEFCRISLDAGITNPHWQTVVRCATRMIPDSTAMESASICAFPQVHLSHCGTEQNSSSLESVGLLIISMR